MLLFIRLPNSKLDFNMESPLSLVNMKREHF
jgi:hypothetical protein